MSTISHITLPDGTDYNIQATGIFFGQVDSTSTSTIYTATIPGVTEYYDGLTILLKNGIVTSASGFTININSLGAKGVYSNMGVGYGTTAATRETTIFNINYSIMLIYSSTIVSGGGWIFYRGYCSDLPSTILELVQNDDDPPSWVINGSPIEDIEYCFNGEGTWTPIIILRKHVVDFEGSYPPINGNTENYYLSKLYTTYEPTIIGGFEEYIITGYLVFQAIINDNGIKKIKTITISDTFYQYDYLVNATITFSEEVVNIPHCCSSTLSSAGWYRVLHVTNPTGSISRVIDLTITRNYVNANNESHCIKYIGNYNSHSFNDEVSKSNTILVDKVRYTTDSNYGYVDIHYAGTSANKVAVDFECYADIGLKQACVAESLQSVADAPSGETIVTTYNFALSTYISGSIAGSYGTIYYDRKGDVCSIYGDVTGVPTGAWTTLATGLPAPARTQFFTAQNGSSTDFVMCQLNTSGTLKFYGRGSHSSGYPTWTYVCN